MPRRTVYNSSIPSVTDGIQSQLQSDNEANLMVANAGGNVVDVTLVADTSAYADNDVLAVPQEVTGVFRRLGGRVILESVVLLDEADQGTEVELVFMNATGTLGTINEAVSISDADARKVLGTVLIAAADYSDLINSQVATKRSLGLMLEAAADSSSLFIAAIVRSGTPTYAASSLKLKLGFRPA